MASPSRNRSDCTTPADRNEAGRAASRAPPGGGVGRPPTPPGGPTGTTRKPPPRGWRARPPPGGRRASSGSCRGPLRGRSEEHTSELQSRQYLVCRLLLEKKNNNRQYS